MLKEDAEKSVEWQTYKNFVEDEIQKTFKGTENKQIYAIRWIALQTFYKYELHRRNKYD